MSVGNRGTGGFQAGRPGPTGGPGGGQRPPGPPPTPFPRPSDADLRAIVEDGDAERLVMTAENVGKALARPPDRRDLLTTSQIRGVFGAVREIEMNWPTDAAQGADAQIRIRRCHRQLLPLKPKLAYQARRLPGRGVDNLRQVIDPAIGLVGQDRERFQNFVDFFEAILAYHRAHGGQ